MNCRNEGGYMDRDAIGLIETIGMAAAIEAADTAVKSANVKLIGYELSKGQGMVTVKISGNVGAVKAAISAARTSAEAVNKVVSTLLIPRPAESLEMIIESKETIGIEKYEEKKSESNDELENNEIKEKEEYEVNKLEQIDEPTLEDGGVKEVIESNKDICNLCFDENCPRRKGQSKTLCIHYNEKQGD